MANRKIRSKAEACAILFEPAGEGEFKWDPLDSDVALRASSVEVFPTALPRDRAVFAEFVGHEWRGRATAGDRQGCVFWGLLKRTEDGEVVVAELEIAPLVPNMLTPTMLGSLSLDRILTRARARMREKADWIDTAAGLGWELPPSEEVERIKELGRKARASRTRRGRRGNPPEFYRAFALEALEVQVEKGITRGLRGELAKRRHQSIGTIRDWLRRCRDLGFLAEAEWGKAGVSPGPNLRG
jgi:hypothetical protein